MTATILGTSEKLTVWIDLEHIFKAHAASEKHDSVKTGSSIFNGERNDKWMFGINCRHIVCR